LGFWGGGGAAAPLGARLIEVTDRYILKILLHLATSMD